MPRYYVMEFVDWVNVVPITADGQIVMIEQYRHGGGETFLEIPGGSTHGPDEDPKIAWARELEEETGYTSKTWIYCGYHFPNPALQTNKMHTFLAVDCVKTAEPELDPFEDLSVHLYPIEEVHRKWEAGEIRHSLISNSLSLAFPRLMKLVKMNS